MIRQFIALAIPIALIGCGPHLPPTVDGSERVPINSVPLVMPAGTLPAHPVRAHTLRDTVVPVAFLPGVVSFSPSDSQATAFLNALRLADHVVITSSAVEKQPGQNAAMVRALAVRKYLLDLGARPGVVFVCFDTAKDTEPKPNVVEVRFSNRIL